MVRSLILLSLALPLAVAVAAGQQVPLGCGAQGSHQWLASRPSPLDSATLEVQGSIAKICYSRPRARGRSVDSLVPLRRAWRTGANEATTLTLTSTMTVGGAHLAPGRYVVLTVPEVDTWTLVFHTTPETEPARMFANLTQVAVGAGRLEHLAQPIDQFTIRPLLEDSGAAFVLEWGTWRIHVPVRVVE